MSYDRLIEVLERKGLLTSEEAKYIMETPAVVTEIKLGKKEEISLHEWPCMPDHKILKAWLKTKKTAGGAISQTTMNTSGKVLTRAVEKGWTVNECLETAEDSKWKGLKDKYFEDRRLNKGQMSTFENLTDRSWGFGLDLSN